MSDVIFRKKYPWALLPYKRKADLAIVDQDRSVYEASFRWFRRSRVEERCWPWRLGYELGWVVPCPVDITMTPISDSEIGCSTEGDLTEFAKATTHDELWRRETTIISMRRTPWMRLYDFRTAIGWESMFIPNGNSSVEWHLGWEVEIPESYFLMVIPADSSEGLEVPVGILDQKTLRTLNEHAGMSIAVRPHKKVLIKRRQPIARVVLLHGDSIRTQGRMREEL